MATTAFSFGGTTLASLGKVTLMHDYLDFANRRGDNQVVPFRHGTVFAQKYFDQRTMVFGMAITAANAAALETTFDTMRSLFSLRTEQTLSMTREDGTIRTVQASVDKTMDVERITNTLARVVVEFTLCKPYFRLSTAIADNTTTIDASPKAMTVTNPGTIEERDPIITIDGPFSSMTILNSTNGVSLTYTGSIGAAETVIIQTNSYGEYTAVLSTGSANVIGNVTHSGSAALMTFNPGNNTMSITSAGGDNSGTLKVSFNAPFL